MHKMLSLADHMMDELKDGKSYAACAAKCHDTERSLCDTYTKLAKDRLDCFRILKQEAARVYEDMARKATERGEDAKYIVEVHEWYMEKAAHEETELSKMIENLR